MASVTSLRPAVLLFIVVASSAALPDNRLRCCFVENFTVNTAIHLPRNGTCHIYSCRHNCRVPDFSWPDWFHSHPEITELRLNNSDVEWLPPNSFAGAHRLEVLDLTGNRIERLRDQQFAGARLLWSIRLSHNRIATVDPQAFAANRMMLELFLDHNRLTAFEASVVGLRALHLQGNQIGHVTGGVARVVQMLDVSNNNVSSIDGGAYGGR